MSRGIVVGTVYNKDGNPAKGAKVKVHHVEGSNGKLRIQAFESKTDRNGKYATAFLWSGVEHGYGEIGKNTFQIRIVAWTEVGDLVKDGYSRDTSFTARTIDGYLAQDILKPINTATGNPFNSMPDMADFAISIAQALLNYKHLVPFWKISEVMSTEQQLIAGGMNLWLDNTN